VDELEVIAEALRRVREADDLVGPTGFGSLIHRRARDRAVLEALTAGVPLEEIADELGVLISDVERMRETARQPTPS
jgi:FixJ family two-component response regulator